MLALAFLQWWYGPGWRRAGLMVTDGLKHIIRSFSVVLLIQTLFSPWRRIITYRSDVFIENMKALLDNFVSRCVGAVVRSMVLIGAAIGLAVTALAGGIWFLLWPLLPFIALAMILRGLLPW